jgi:SAM-dependent methyltransferase
MPLPGNVSYTTVREPGIMPLPYPDSIFTHVRTSTLPSLVPSSDLPKLLRECHRLLAPGGMLEIRIMDAAPVRKTAGPKMRGWIEDRLSINLERHFRCSKPCMLIPAWVKDAGFELAHSTEAQIMRLPCATAKDVVDVDVELKANIGRALWKNIWGEFVDDDPDEARWWWEDEEVMQECLERQTVFECGAIFAHKK